MNNTTETLPPGPSTASDADDGNPSFRRSPSRGPLLGLIGVIVAFVAIGAFFSLQQTPFVGADEKAHLGYAHVVAHGSLPQIDTRLPVPTSAHQWMSEMIYTHEDENRSVWVANHPPLPYVVAVPSIWWSEATERSDGGLLFMRLANVMWGAVGVAFTYLIAQELTRSRRLALLSAATAAMVTQLFASLSLGMTDGMTYAAGAAVTWAGLRCLQRGATNPNLALLSALGVVAAGVRAVTMLIAFGVVAVVAMFELRDRWAQRSDAWSAALRICVLGVVPAVVAWGWFYVRNIVLYGDIGASSFLLERFDREPNGSVLATFNNGDLWRALYTRSMSPMTYAGPRPPLMMLVAALVIGGLVGVWLTRRTGDRGRADQPHPIARRSIVLLLVPLAVIVVYIAQHVSGGGYLHPRYAFPALGSVAVLVVVGLDRILPRLLPLAVVVAMGGWTLSQLPVGIDPSYARRPRDQGRLAPAALRTLPGDDVWRALAVVGIVAGCAIAVVALVGAVLDPAGRPSLRRWRLPTSPADEPVSTA